MSEHYHDAADFGLLKDMRKLAPVEFDAWLALDKIIAREGGAIPRKNRELIALAVACRTRCPIALERTPRPQSAKKSLSPHSCLRRCAPEAGRRMELWR